MTDTAAFIVGTVTRPDWFDRIACHGMTDVMFPEQGETSHKAKAICGTCPVVAECHAYCHSWPQPIHGVWAGMSDNQRRADLRSSRPTDVRGYVIANPRTRQPISHGTPHGAGQHRRRNEVPCECCRLAANTYNARLAGTRKSRHTNKEIA